MTFINQLNGFEKTIRWTPRLSIKSLLFLLFVATLSITSHSTEQLGELKSRTSVINPSSTSFSFFQTYLNPSCSLSDLEPLKESLNNQWIQLQKPAIDFHKKQEYITTFISQTHNSHLTEIEKKTILGRLILLFADLPIRNSKIKTFFQKSLEPFNEYILDMMTYFVKTNSQKGFYALANAFNNLEWNPVHIAFHYLNQNPNNPSEEFHSYFSMCSTQEQKYLSNVILEFNKKLKPENKELSPSREGALVLSESPKIFLYPDLLSKEDCKELTQNTTLSNAEIVNSFGHRKTSTTRKAQVTSLIKPSVIHKKTVKKIVELFKTYFNIPEENIEDLNLIFYAGNKEDYFDFHFDAYNEKLLHNLRQRVATIILYLNTVENGGETYFPKSNLKVSPRQGSLLYFDNINKDKSICNEHKGQTLSDEQGKWIVTSHILENMNEEITTQSSVRNSRDSLPIELDLDDNQATIDNVNTDLFTHQNHEKLYSFFQELNDNSFKKHKQ